MEHDTTIQPPPPPPYYLPGQTPADPNLQNQEQQPDNVVVVQDPNYEPEECCTCFCTIKWILIFIGGLILFPILLALYIIAMMYCPRLVNKVEHRNERNM